MNPKIWSTQVPIYHQKSYSDPLDYFTLHFQNIQISEFRNAHYDEELLKIRKLKSKSEKKKNPFTVDASII